MQKYNSIYKKQTLKESLSFLELYKLGSNNVMSMVEEFIKKFNAPRIEIYRALSDLFNVLASEAEKQMKEKGKK